MFSLSDPRYQLGKWRGSWRLEMGGAGEIEEQEELQPSLQTFQVRTFFATRVSCYNSVFFLPCMALKCLCRT